MKYKNFILILVVPMFLMVLQSNIIGAIDRIQQYKIKSLQDDIKNSLKEKNIVKACVYTRILEQEIDPKSNATEIHSIKQIIEILTQEQKEKCDTEFQEFEHRRKQNIIF